MKYAEIEKKFADKVVEYFAKGYTLNTETMSGTQGEIAKVDFKAEDGKIIRVMIDTYYDADKKIRITVTTGTADGDTYWNNDKKEVLFSEEWYKISDSWYADEEEYFEYRIKHRNRWKQNANQSKKFLSERSFDIAARAARKISGMKRTKASDIQSVSVQKKSSGMVKACYIVTLKNMKRFMVEE